MAKKDPKETKQAPEAEPEKELPAEETPQQEAPTEAPAKEPEIDWKKKYDDAHDAHLRLAAEYDNFRNRKSDTVLKILPVYDNLERALNQPTEDAAYKKGVEMTMNELVKILTGLGVEIFGAVGDTFDPALHNAVMHTEDESLGENVIAAVFQKGFRIGDKVVRFAMVQVAN